MYGSSESCYQCGLPLPKKPFLEKASGKKVLYCCYGCFLTHEITGEKGDEGEALWILLRLGLSAFFAMNVVILSFADYIYPFGENVVSIINYIKMILSIPVMILLGFPILKNSIRFISNLTLNMDALIVIGTFSAFILSTYSTFNGEGKVYFDTASMILVLVTVGRLLEASAKAQTSNAIQGLLELSPREATIVRNGKEEKVSIECIRKEEIIRVIPGDSFPIDGEVLEGVSSVDESMLTGESKPVFKEKGSKVYSGTTNIDGKLILRTTHVGEDMVLSRLVKVLQDARRWRAPVERVADRISSIFIPVALVMSIMTFLFWIFISGINVALMNSLSVLLISCPCALGLATPMAIWVSLGRAAKEGILIRSGKTLEKISRIKRIFFDKTGTLTKRNTKLSTVSVSPNLSIRESDLIRLAASLESASEHPIGKSLVEFANKHGLSLFRVTDFRTYPGLGIKGKINGKSIFLGSNKFIDMMVLNKNEILTKKIEQLESEGKTVIFCSWDKEVKGILGFSEEIREETVEAISNLKNLGLDVLILTGDSRYAATALAKNLGVGIKSELLPDDKVEEIKSFKKGLNAMVGDGINDAPALSAADVGIALGCGMDITRESADISLLGNDLRKIPWVFQLGKKTLRKIKENLFWAFFYNIVGIGLAIAGVLQPVVAAIAMILSSLFVLGNSLRLSRLKIDN